MLPFVAPLAIVALGTFIVWRALLPQLAVQRSRRWASTRGRVVDVRLYAGRLEVAGPPEPRHATARVRYEYTVRGRRYEGTRINFFGLSRQAAIEAAVRFGEEPEVTVWYDPQAPERSVLDRAPSLAGVLELLLGAGVLAVGLRWLVAVIDPGR